MQRRELVDMEELAAHGAAGFTDDGIPLMDEALVKCAMERAAKLDLPLSLHEEDRAFIESPGVNQGAVSKALGLGGAPALAEDVLVARDCMLALHTGRAGEHPAHQLGELGAAGAPGEGDGRACDGLRPRRIISR